MWKSILILCFILMAYCVHTQVDSTLSLQQYTFIPAPISINQIVVSEDNEKIVATDKGIYKISHRKQRPLILGTLPTQSLAITNKNVVWALSNNSLINIQTNEKFFLPEGNKYNNIIYHRFSIWVASNDGLYKFNIKTNKVSEHFTAKNSKLPSNDINFVFSDKENKLWIGTTNGIAIVDTKDKWKVYEKDRSMESMAYNSEGLWLVSDQEMWLIDAFGRWYPTAIELGLKDGPVRDITTDQDGRLILASRSIVRYNPYDEEIHSYSKSLSFLSKKTNTLEGDLNRNIWIGTEDDGLFILSFTDTELPELNAIIEIQQNITCDKPTSGKIHANVFGGKEPYSFDWNEGMYASQTIKNLSAGIYNLMLTDANNNTTTAQIELYNPPLEAFVEDIKGVTKIKNSDGQATVVVTSGKEPFSFLWDDGKKDQKRSNLSSGLHIVKISDANQCEIELNVEIPRDKYIPNLDISSIEVGQTLQINELYFPSDSFTVVQSSFEVLDEIYSFLIQNPSVVIEIGGHTNNVPPKEYCDRLSAARARNVAEYLSAKGISKSRIQYKGYGKDLPIASNDTIEGRKKNQRVEIKILSVKG